MKAGKHTDELRSTTIERIVMKRAILFISTLSFTYLAFVSYWLAPSG